MEKIKIKTLVFAYKLCKKIRFKIVNLLLKDKPLSQTTYVSLTPSKIKRRNEYFNAMDFALSKNDVRNIAVTGSYGAGKSTVIRSYMEKFRPEAFINVSLAGFEMQEKGEPAKAQEVELSILQQILYKKNRDALPDSRIDRILNRNQAHIRRVFWSVLKVAAPLCGILALIYQDKLLKLTGIPEGVFSFINVTPYLKAVFLFILILAALYFITECASQIGIFDKKIKLNKLALLSGEMDLGSAETSSLLNNCLDEIVYFFSRIDNYRIVIFEDLDRLKNPDIFVKLREINKIVNNNLSDDNPLRFIYAVRDDIFSGAEARTKFFDFIIPVVPVMDSRNAFSLLNDKMKVFIPGGEECLRSTAVYINDMRSLQNIVNEYRVFSEVVDNTKRNISLYAMVFYKNMFSHDYSLIDRKVSILYKFIYHYRTLKLHENYFGGLDERISSLSDALNDIREEKSRTAEDVRKSIIHALIPENLTEIVQFYRPHVGNNFHQHTLQKVNTPQLISNEQAFMDLFEKSSQVSIGYIYQNRNQVIELSDSERTEISESYQRRKKTVGEERDLNFKQVEKALREAREDKRRKNAISLADLVTLMKREKFTDVARQYMEEISQHDLLSAEQKKAVQYEMQYGGYDALYLLLSRGYLDQDFMRSRSVFHEGGLSASDNEFVKNVALGLSGEQSNEEVAIDDVAGVIREIAAQSLLHHDAVMHHQIISHMLRRNDTHLDEMIATLFSKNGEYILNLLVLLEARFAAADSFPSLLVRALDKNGYLDTLVFCLKAGDNREVLSLIAAAVVSWVSPDCADNRAEYRKYVESLGTVIVHSIEPARLQSFLTNIKGLKVCYEALSSPLTDEEKDCVRFIGIHHLYRLTSENVGIVLSTQLHSHGFTVRECQNLPWTFATLYDPDTLRYFLENPDTFVRSVFLNSQEEAPAVNAVLKLTSLSDEMKLSIVRDMSFTVCSLAGIPEEPRTTHEDREISLHDLFYLYDRVAPEWESLMDYIYELCDEDVLTGYLSRHADVLASGSPGVVDGDNYDLLHVKVVCNDNLDELTYLKIINNIEINEHHLDERISLTNLTRLIKNRKIILNADNFTRVTGLPFINIEKNITLFISWFSLYCDEFKKNSDLYTFRSSDTNLTAIILSLVMNSPLFDIRYKQGLAALFDTFYSDCSAENLIMPKEVKTNLLNTTGDINLRDKLFMSLVSGGFKNRRELLEYSRRISEPGIAKIFTNLTEATFEAADSSQVFHFLDALSAGGLIEYHELRDDGKFHVKISRLFSYEER